VYIINLFARGGSVLQDHVVRNFWFDAVIFWNAVYQITAQTQFYPIAA